MQTPRQLLWKDVAQNRGRPVDPKYHPIVPLQSIYSTAWLFNTSSSLEQPNLIATSSRRSGGRRSYAGSCLVKASRIIVVLVDRLEELHWDVFLQARGQNLRASNNRTRKESDEEDEQHKVEHSISPHASLSELGLLQRVDWRSDLSTVWIG